MRTKNYAFWEWLFHLNLVRQESQIFQLRFIGDLFNNILNSVEVFCKILKCIILIIIYLQVLYIVNLFELNVRQFKHFNELQYIGNFILLNGKIKFEKRHNIASVTLSIVFYKYDDKKYI